MVKVVAVFGVSGVGKSSMISRYASGHAVMHVQASQLLREAKAAISGAIYWPSARCSNQSIEAATESSPIQVARSPMTNREW